MNPLHVIGVLLVVGLGAMALSQGGSQSNGGDPDAPPEYGVGTLVRDGVTGNGLRFRVYQHDGYFYYEVSHSPIWEPERRIGAFNTLQAALDQVEWEK